MDIVSHGNRPALNKNDVADLRGEVRVPFENLLCLYISLLHLILLSN